MGDLTNVPPFGMSPVLPAFDRATRIAIALFGDVEASVVLVDGDRVWRSAGRFVGTRAPADGARFVIDSHRALWLDDLAAEPSVSAEAHLAYGLPRFYAAAPVLLANGTAAGALTVYGAAPRAHDAALAARLQDLAGGIGDECERAFAAEQARLRDHELVKARKVMAAFVASVPIEAVMTDRDLRVLTATPRWLDRFGLAEPVVGRALRELAPEAFSVFEDDFRRCLVGETVRRDRLQVNYRGRNGWVNLEMTPWRDEAGDVAGVISAAHDVTDTVEAMRQSERTQQRLQLAAEMANIYVYDIDYRRRLVESAGKNIYQINDENRKAIIESVFTDAGERYIDPRDRARIAEATRRFEAGEPFVEEYRTLRPDGAEFWVAEVMQASRNRQGRIVRVIGASQDVTARKQAEQALIRAKEGAEAANHAKSAFLATMSHEIRTPLNGVLGMAQAMAAGPLEPAQRERLDVIRQSGETLLAVLNDVLDLPRSRPASWSWRRSSSTSARWPRASTPLSRRSPRSKAFASSSSITRAARRRLPGRRHTGAPAAGQPRLQRPEVHRDRPRGGEGRPPAPARSPSASATPASASPRPSRRRCSASSTKPTPRPPGDSAAPASAWRSAASLPS